MKPSFSVIELIFRFIIEFTFEFDLKINVNFRFVLLAVFAAGAPMTVGCGWEDDYDWTLTDCESDQQCLELSDGELDHCGVWEAVETNLCCKLGAHKCGCRADGSCVEGSTCLTVPNSAATPPEFCYIEAIGAVLGAQPVSAQSAP